MPKPADSGKKSRSELDRAFRKAGAKVGKGLGSGREAASITASGKRKFGVLEKFVDPKSKKLRPNAKINQQFRAAMPGHDELFSTASVREFVKGAVKNKKRTDYDSDEWNELLEHVDTISDLRIPTEHSGYSLHGRAMQHPANRSRAFFEDPYRTASEHSTLDQERRRYIVRALETAVDDEEDAAEIVEAGARASIEFTLNYFTAPVTAANVHPFSRQAATSVDDAENVEQVTSRERLKGVYVELGGSLAPTNKKEKKTQRLTRQWTGPPITGDYQEAPPSPFRLPET